MIVKQFVIRSEDNHPFPLISCL